MSDDPTSSKTKRDRWQRKLHKRWREVRGEFRDEIESNGYLRPQSDISTSDQVADFREYYEDLVEEEVIEPTTQRNVKNGAHYTAPLVREFYEHGLKLADRKLEDAGYDVPDQSTREILRAEHHEDALHEAYLEAYQDIEDAGRAAEQEATRDYRDAARDGAAAALVIKLVNDRSDKVGRYRTDLVAQAKSIQTINEAAVNRYAETGVEEVAAIIEFDIDVEETETQHRVQTAEDDRVCSICREKARNGPYTIEEILNDRSLIPPYEHPNCRCLLVPVQVTADS